MNIKSVCDYVSSRVDAVDAAVERGEWSDSVREELAAMARLLREALEEMK